MIGSLRGRLLHRGAGEIIVELEPAADGPILAVELRDVLLSPLGEGFAKAEAHELPEIRLDDLHVAR